MTDSAELTRDLRQLIQVTKVIGSSLVLDEQLPCIMDATVKLTSADKAILFLYDGSGNIEIKAEFPSAMAQSTREQKYSRSLVEQVLRTGTAEFVLDTDLNLTLRDRASIQALQLRTVMCTPLRSRTGLLGALYVHSSTPMRAFNEQKKEIFVALSDYAAIALDNAKLYAASISDPMTGLYNHAYCLRRLSEELDRARRYGRRLSFILMDIDHFKTINDNYGHRKGDAVISTVAQVLQQSVRVSDIAARYGGDEFALVVPETGAETTLGNAAQESGALILAERVRERIASVEVDGVDKITASIGVAVFPSDGFQEGDPSDLIERADSAMYAAKRAGRNRVSEAKARSLVT